MKATADPMKITCPHCGFTRSVDPAQVPERPVRVTCPRCRQRFGFEKTRQVGEEANGAGPSPETSRRETADAPQVTCPACGLTQAAGETCAGCGVVYARWRARMDAGNGGPDGGRDTDDLPERRIICQACGTVQAPASHCAYCQAEITTFAPRTEPEYAGFWIRVVAYLIDSFIIGGVQLVLGLVFELAVGSLGGLTAQGDTAMGMVTWLFSAVLGISYAVFFIGHCGQTPGKMALRIKVLGTDGSPVSYGRAFLREVPGKFLSSVLFGIGYLMVAFDSRKQGLHDKIASTYVIKL